MSNFKGHLTGGLIISSINTLTFTYLYNIKTGIITGITSLLFSLYPDMDIKSHSQRIVTAILTTLIIYFLYNNYNATYTAFVGFLIIMPMLHKHRGYNHSIINGFVLCLIWLGILSAFFTIDLNKDYIYNIALLSGYWTHLILDRHWKAL